MVLNPFRDSSWSDTLDFQADIPWQIRAARRRDVPALAELERITFRKPWTAAQLDEEFLHPERSFFLVAVGHQDGKEYLLGYISWWQILDQADILNVSVHPSWRRKGIAKGLLKTALAEMEEHGIRLVTLEVAKKKTEAQALYLNSGFIFVGEIKGYYPEYADDALLMNKSFEG